MLVDNSVYKNSYTGTGTTTEFPITFPFLENKHIQVIQSTDNGITESEVPSSDYTISGAGLESGGTCTFKVAPQAGVLIIIRRNVPITQLYAYKELDNFPAESHENALAKLTMIDQQQQEQINRAFKVPGASQQSPEELMDELFQIRDDSEAAKSAAEAAKSAAEAAQSAAEDCRDTACECASQAQNTLDSAVQVIQNQESISKNAVITQEQASVTAVQTEGDTQAKRLEDIATTILISAASYNKSVSVKLTSAITSGETYTLPESLAYLVGRSQLFVSGNGVWFYKGFQYDEVGTDGVASTTIKFLQDLAVDDVLTFTLLANRVNVLTATNSGLVNDADGHLKLNVDGQTVLINASGQVYVPVMVGATADNAGTAGLVPQPAAGKQNKPLTGGGNYADSLDCDISGHAAKDLPLTGGIVTGNVTVTHALHVDGKGVTANVDFANAPACDEICRIDAYSNYIRLFGTTTQKVAMINIKTGEFIGNLSGSASHSKGADAASLTYTTPNVFMQRGSYTSGGVLIPAGGTWRCCAISENEPTNVGYVTYDLPGGSNFNPNYGGYGYMAIAIRIA